MNFIKQRLKAIEQAKLMGVPKVGDRQRGYSTGLALKFIGTAMLEEGSYIEVWDHHKPETMKSKLFMLEVCADLIQRLGLEGFQFRKSVKPSIKYSLELP